MPGYPQNIRNITVTNASGIGYGALSGLSNLTTLTINKEVTSVGKSAFKDSGIQTLTVPFVGASRSATGEARDHKLCVREAREAI